MSKMGFYSLNEAIDYALDAKRYEPKPRLHAGVFGYVAHRFPIKDGISAMTVAALQMSATNSLFQRLNARNSESS